MYCADKKSGRNERSGFTLSYLPSIIAGDLTVKTVHHLGQVAQYLWSRGDEP
jgi:hypothetical protein